MATAAKIAASCSDVASVASVGAMLGGALAAIAAAPWGALKFLRKDVL
jgi:hypothetical protein